MITREQVADLKPGDVVEMTGGFLNGATLRGPVWERIGWLLLGPEQIVRSPDGEPSGDAGRTLTVISRAPRRCYVNHDRTEPVAGDVVRDADSDEARVWMHLGGRRNDWAGHRIGDMVLFTSGDMPKRLRLLVDGETGQAVTA